MHGCMTDYFLETRTTEHVAVQLRVPYRNEHETTKLKNEALYIYKATQLHNL